MKKSNNTTQVDTERDSFVFYKSFKSAIDQVAKSQQPKLYEAIVNYSLYRIEPDVEGRTKLAWVLIKPQLDANWRKYESGRRGGAPKGNYNAQKQPKNNQKQPNVNVNEKENVNVNDNLFLGTTTTTPSLSEISEYVSEKRLNVDSEYFHDYYTSVGWKAGSRPIVDWRAILRNWHRMGDRYPDTNSTLDAVKTAQIALTNDL